MADILKRLQHFNHECAKRKQYPQEDGTIAGRGAFWLAKSMAAVVGGTVC
jgi:hypothetical protein